MFNIRLLAVTILMMSLLLFAATAGAQEPVTVDLAAQNDSGISGTATLTEAGDGQTEVQIDVSGSEEGGSHPVHIHEGTCDDLNPAPAHPLSPVEGGMSTTTVDVALADLTGGEFAINGHQSSDDLETYIFCGNIPAGAGDTAAQEDGAATGDAGDTATEEDGAATDDAAEAEEPQALPETGADNSTPNYVWLLVMVAGGLFVLGANVWRRTQEHGS